MKKLIKIDARDNVAIAVEPVCAGEALIDGIIALDDVPQGHKIALEAIPRGGAVIRYGVTLGYALGDVARGRWINEHMLRLPPAPALDDMPWGVNLRTELPAPTVRTWRGYKNPNGGYGGTRNILGIQTTVQCVQGVLDAAVARIKRELLPKYKNVDDVVAINHAYGCGVAINAPEAVIPVRALRNLCRHPNFGGELMVVALGCEKLTPEMLVGERDANPDNVIVLQEEHGFEGGVDAIMRMAERKLRRLDARRREELPLSALMVGMQCGGSDAFSGVTANPAAGYAADMLVSGGATVLFSEVTEVRDGVHLLAERCVSAEVRDRLAREMKWYDDYLLTGNVDRSANPSPGNKKGGLSNIVEKALGSIAKSGTSPITDVLAPAEIPTVPGMIFAATPASDMVCGPCQLASGIGLQVFMTGRGTPYGLAAAPVIKVCTRNELFEQWPDLIDLCAGPIATGEKDIPQVGRELFDMIIATASGEMKPWAEKFALNNFMCIFNPAPIT